MLKKLILLGLLVPMVLIKNVSAENEVSVPVVRSIDVVYEINLDSKISVSEKITFENGQMGEFIRIIPKTVEFKNDGKEEKISYSLKNIVVSDASSAEVKNKIREDNDGVKITIALSDLTSEKRILNIKYEIDRSINIIGKKDESNERNNIELLGNLGVLSGGEEYTVKSVTAEIKSPYVVIGTMECFAGDIQNEQRMCFTEYDKNGGKSSSTNFLGQGKGFLISFKMMKGGDVKTPAKGAVLIGRIWDYLRVNVKEIALYVLVILVLIYIVRKLFYVYRSK